MMRHHHETQMVVSVEWVTPEMAAEWLRHPNDRPEVKSDTRAFERKLRNGEMVLTHQGIALDVNGCLQDGAHRCRAAVNTGIGFLSYVTRNCPVENFNKIDVGAKRTNAHMLAIRGIKNYKKVAAVGRYLVAWERGRTSFVTYDVTDQDIADLIERHPDMPDSMNYDGREERRATALGGMMLNLIGYMSADEAFMATFTDADRPENATPADRLRSTTQRRAKMRRVVKGEIAVFVKARNDWSTQRPAPTQNYGWRDREEFPRPLWNPPVQFAAADDPDEE
jgi:hypothetical protein